MFAFLLYLWTYARSGQAPFMYWDGRRNRVLAVDEVGRRLGAHIGFDLRRDPLRRDTASVAKCARTARVVFGLKPHADGGLPQSEAAGLWVRFVMFVDQQR